MTFSLHCRNHAHCSLCWRHLDIECLAYERAREKLFEDEVTRLRQPVADAK